MTLINNPKMSQDLQIHENKLTIQYLYDNPELALKQDQVMAILNQPPPVKWVKEHPFIKGYKYLPIDKVEFLLKKLFKGSKIKVKKTGQLFNTVEVTVRIKYKDIATGEWTYQEGVGACELQTKKDTGVLKPDFSNVNPGAVTMALPIAKTLAIKDACDLIGDIFGGNLNRKDTIQIMSDSILENVVKTKEEERLIKLIERAKDIETLESLKTHIVPNVQSQFDLKWKELSR